MQRRVRGCRHRQEMAAPGQRQQRLDIGLDVVEIDGARFLAPLLLVEGAHGQPGDALALIQPLALRDEFETALEQPDTVLLTVAVPNRRIEQTRPEAGPHDRQFSGQRILQGQRLDAGLDPALQLGLDETVGDGLLIAPVHQKILGSCQREFRLGNRLHDGGDGGLLARQAVIPVDPTNLLDQIRLDDDIETKRGRGHSPAGSVGLRVHAQTLQDPGHFLALDVDAQEAAEPLGTQGNRLAGRQMLATERFHHRAGLATRETDDQFAGTSQGPGLEFGTDAPLEAVG